MAGTHFYIRVIIEQIPEDKRQAFALRSEKNYPVLGIDSEKSRVLIPDDHMRLLWIPMSVCRFVRLAS